jgi:FkbH-like protein
VGVLLAVVSKNSEADVQEVFQKHPMMALRREDFAAIRVNWLSKPENILSIANELNLAPDSMVFLDDNPVERDLVRRALPMVAVPEVPEAVELKSWLLGEVATEFFGKIRLTNEDREKTEQYRANSARTELASQLSLEEYLSTLKIRVIVDVNAVQSRARVTQLIQKTTQFNLTGRHYTEAEIESMYDDPNRIIFSLQYEDKFGKEGLVAAAVLVCNGMCALIDTFVMSCRVVGRTVEMMFLRSIMQHLQARGIMTIYGEYFPTARNTVASEVYLNAGFKEESETRYSGEIDSLLLGLEAQGHSL